MGQPAARAGDSTAHGGVIAAGAPTVFIGKMPAARLGDPHVCPMINPGPVPHVGMPIAKGSMGVNICGMPAARVGDIAPCSGPPDTIAMGCPTVNIGETKPGGGGSAGAAPTAAAQAAAYSAAVGGTPLETDEPEDHFIDIAVKDTAGFPIARIDYSIYGPSSFSENGFTYGGIKRHGVPAGTYQLIIKAIITACWGCSVARNGETVDIIVETEGIDDGEIALIQIWSRSLNHPDAVITHIDTESIQNGQIRTNWKPIFTDDFRQPGSYYTPAFYFSATVGGISCRSGFLNYMDYVEISLRGTRDEPINNEPYEIILSNGEIRTGFLDPNGFARIEHVPLSIGSISFPQTPATSSD
jgi:uncharacterized Zn-binding protein involved in type VI secretion